MLLSMSSFEREWSFCAQKYDHDSRKQKAEKSSQRDSFRAKQKAENTRDTRDECRWYFNGQTVCTLKNK